MKHPVMWFEVLGKDAGKLCQFYGALFGWSFGGDPSGTDWCSRTAAAFRAGLA